MVSWCREWNMSLAHFTQCHNFFKKHLVLLLYPKVAASIAFFFECKIKWSIFKNTLKIKHHFILICLLKWYLLTNECQSGGLLDENAPAKGFVHKPFGLSPTSSTCNWPVIIFIFSMFSYSKGRVTFAVVYKGQETLELQINPKNWTSRIAT